MPFATVNGLTLHYKIDGPSDGTPLVLLHSLGTDLRLWDDLIPNLNPAFRFIRFDHRGHGLSETGPDGDAALEHFTDDAAALLDHLGIGQALFLGISIGGLIALDFALRHPERVNSLILSDTTAKIGTSEMWQQRMDTLRAHGMAHLGNAILARWFAPDFAQRRPAHFRGAFTLLTRNTVAGYTAACAALRDADLRSEVHRITTPALILCGAEDSATPPDVVQELAASLPNARFTIIPQAGHTPPSEQPETMAAKINAFLQSP